MYQKRMTHMFLSLILAVLLGATAGCDWNLVGMNATSFAMGFLTAMRFPSTTTEYHCYRGGVEIDCGQIPGQGN